MYFVGILLVGLRKIMTVDISILWWWFEPDPSSMRVTHVKFQEWFYCST